MSKKNKSTKKAMKNTTKSKAAKPDGAPKAPASNLDLVSVNDAIKPSKANGTKKETSASRVASAETKPKKLSCLDAAAQVLQSEGKAMTCKQMIDAMFNAKLWHSDAPTPAATLSSAILREMTKKRNESRFIKTDRGLFEARK